MTHPILLDQCPGRTTTIPALRATGGSRYPVKVVEHPAFRAARRHAGPPPFTLVSLPVVLLNGSAVEPASPRSHRGLMVPFSAHEVV